MYAIHMEIQGFFGITRFFTFITSLFTVFVFFSFDPK